MSQFSGDGGILGGSPGDGMMTGTGGGDPSQQSSLYPITPRQGGGPTVAAYVNCGTKDERVRLYIGGMYNRVSYSAVGIAAVFPVGAVLALEYSMDGNDWYAPASAVELSAAGNKPGNDSTGFIWASVKVKTTTAGYALVTISASNTTA